MNERSMFPWMVWNDDQPGPGIPPIPPEPGPKP